MDALIASGHSLIVALQSWRTPVFDLAFRSPIFLGEEDLLLALVPALWRIVGKRPAMRLLPLLLLSVWLDSLLKTLLGWPCPFEPTIARLAQEVAR